MNNKFILGIDASNISVGGGLTHIIELLNIISPSIYGFNKVIIWSSRNTLEKISSRKWLNKKSNKFLDKNILFRVIWQKFILESDARKENCDLLFIPGGSFTTKFRPIVTSSQNLLPFEWTVIKKYGISFYTVKWLLLRYSQRKSIIKSNGVIFLSQYSMNIIEKLAQVVDGRKVVIPYGIRSSFFTPPRTQYPISEYSKNNPLKIIYVTSLEPYKNNLSVIKAVALLRESGLPVNLSLYGRGSKKNKNKINRLINYYDKYGSIQYYGSIPYSKLPSIYNNADVAIYASSCETFGQTLLEGMAAGLPTICSNNSTMPEFLGSAGVYFDVNNFEEMLEVLRNFIISPKLREQKAELAFQKANYYTWHKCADETFKFFDLIIQDKLNHKKEIY